MKLKKIERIKRLIDVNVPKDGGGFHKQRMGVVYEMLDQDEIERLIEDGDDEATLERILVGQYDNKFEDGEPIEDTPENLDMFKKISYIRSAIIRGYFEMVSGGRTKN